MDTIREMWTMIPTLSLVPTILLGVTLSVAIFAYLYIKIRPKFPVRVNCWFCNKNTDVPYGNRNCWDCPHCEQYNGFSADGGYNKLIPAQQDEMLNHSVAGSSSFTKKTSPHFSKNPFCRKCNINQELKIQQLASFTPREPAFFDEEVEEYRQHLERAYQLCEPCELAVKHTLYHQKTWLLDQHRKRVITTVPQSISPFQLWRLQGLSGAWLQRCHFFCMLVAFCLFMAYQRGSKHIGHFLSPDIVYFLETIPNYESILTFCTTCLLIIVTALSHYRGRIDVFGAALWGILFAHSWLVSHQTFSEKFSENDLKMGHSVLQVLAFVVNSLAAFVPREQFISKRYQQRMREDTRVPNIHNISGHFESSEISTADKHLLANKSPVSPRTKSSPETPCGMTQSVTSTDTVGKTPAPCVNPLLINNPSGASGELEWGLGKLSLGPKTDTSNFRSKMYGSQDSLNVFTMKGSTSMRQRRTPVLYPPKLNMRRNVTQSSWVAGGYWQDLGTSSKSVHSGRTLFDSPIPSFSPLSRSSSQSSGFHSQSSQSPASVPNSCNGSVCGGEVDRISMMSEPTLHYSNDQANYPMFRPHFVGIPYYGYPVYMCPIGLPPASPGMLNPRSPPFVVNPCFVPQKLYQHGAMFPLSQTKDIPGYSPIPSDTHSHSESSRHSNSQNSVMEPVKKNVATGWLIMKQNVFLSVLFLGSLIFNMFGMSLLVYRNRELILM